MRFLVLLVSAGFKATGEQQWPILTLGMDIDE